MSCSSGFRRTAGTQCFVLVEELVHSVGNVGCCSVPCADSAEVNPSVKAVVIVSHDWKFVLTVAWPSRTDFISAA